MPEAGAGADAAEPKLSVLADADICRHCGFWIWFWFWFWFAGCVEGVAAVAAVVGATAELALAGRLVGVGAGLGEDGREAFGVCADDGCCCFPGRVRFTADSS